MEFEVSLVLVRGRHAYTFICPCSASSDVERISLTTDLIRSLVTKMVGRMGNTCVDGDGLRAGGGLPMFLIRVGVWPSHVHGRLFAIVMNVYQPSSFLCFSGFVPEASRRPCYVNQQ